MGQPKFFQLSKNCSTELSWPECTWYFVKKKSCIWKLLIEVDTITKLSIFEAKSKPEWLKPRLSHNYQASLYLYSTKKKLQYKQITYKNYNKAQI